MKCVKCNTDLLDTMLFLSILIIVVVILIQVSNLEKNILKSEKEFARGAVSGYKLGYSEAQLSPLTNGMSKDAFDIQEAKKVLGK